jgi:hypothetical protein
MNLDNGTGSKDWTTLKEDSLFHTVVSCGVTAAYSLSYCSPEEFVERVLKTRKPFDKTIKEAFVIFSDVDYSAMPLYRGSMSMGQRIAAYLKDKNLGYVVETPAEKNPNSGNMIRVWIWHPPHNDDALRVEGKNRIFDQAGRFLRHTADIGEAERFRNLGYRVD